MSIYLVLSTPINDICELRLSEFWKNKPRKGHNYPLDSKNLKRPQIVTFSGILKSSQLSHPLPSHNFDLQGDVVAQYFLGKGGRGENKKSLVEGPNFKN